MFGCLKCSSEQRGCKCPEPDIIEMTDSFVDAITEEEVLGLCARNPDKLLTPAERSLLADDDVELARKGRTYPHDVTSGGTDSRQHPVGGKPFPGVVGGLYSEGDLAKVLEITKTHPDMFQRPAPLGHASTPATRAPYVAPRRRPQRRYRGE